MGCPSEVVIGDDLVFTITTHDPDTGIVTDADGAPNYWIHEDENGTDIDTGTMALLNAADTTGYYSELISCTAVAGYEDGKTYSIYIDATVGGEKGAIAYTFKAVALSMQDLQDSITAAADALYVPTAETVTDGTMVANGTYDDFRDLAADDANRYLIRMVLTPADDVNIDYKTTFSLGAGRVATSVQINGYFDAGGVRACQVYAYNYTTTDWDKLSSPGASTEMRNASADVDYVFSLTTAHTNPAATIGEVQIRFYTDGGGADDDDLYLDYVAVSGTSTGGATPQAIADATWTHNDGEAVARHIPKYTGKVWYVDGTNGASTNPASQPDLAIDTITGAIGLASAGDWIEVMAGSYAEAVTLADNAVELHCEIGTDITGNTGVPLTVSGSGCKVIGAHFTPDAGQIGCIVTGDHNYIEFCRVHTAGLTGFQVAATAEGNELVRCVAVDYSSVGFDLKGFENIYDRCLAIGSGGAVKGFNLSDNAAHRNLFNMCATIDCSAGGWDIDAGADDNLINLCSDSAGCGAAVDGGANNAWRSFGDGSAETALTALTTTGTLSGVAGADMTDRIYTRLFHEVNVTNATGAAAIRNSGDTGNIATGSITDDDTTTQQAGWTWL